MADRRLPEKRYVIVRRERTATGKAQYRFVRAQGVDPPAGEIMSDLTDAQFEAGEIIRGDPGLRKIHPGFCLE
ncbi:MAG TPA: hypothetical protein VM492_07575 [Sumerlaeia bacterium]|nr:hypothetical protein [Sumerlaeia bacterium]